MKNLLKLFTLTLSVMAVSSGIAMAETTQFTPLNFDDSTTIRTSNTTTSAAYTATEAKGTDMLDPSQVTGGTKMQNAILQIDNAQVELRNKLLNAKSVYAEVDTKYETTKAQRKAAKKQIKYHKSLGRDVNLTQSNPCTNVYKIIEEIRDNMY